MTFARIAAALSFMMGVLLVPSTADAAFLDGGAGIDSCGAGPEDNPVNC